MAAVVEADRLQAGSSPNALLALADRMVRDVLSSDRYTGAPPTP
jgi:hypothetical protein